MTNHETTKCCFCGKELDYCSSNNAEPVRAGVCCDECNWKHVIPARMAELAKHEKHG